MLSSALVTIIILQAIQHASSAPTPDWLDVSDGLRVIWMPTEGPNSESGLYSGPSGSNRHEAVNLRLRSIELSSTSEIRRRSARRGSFRPSSWSVPGGPGPYAVLSNGPDTAEDEGDNDPAAQWKRDVNSAAYDEAGKNNSDEENVGFVGAVAVQRELSSQLDKRSALPRSFHWASGRLATIYGAPDAPRVRDSSIGRKADPVAGKHSHGKDSISLLRELAGKSGYNQREKEKRWEDLPAVSRMTGLAPNPEDIKDGIEITGNCGYPLC